MNFKYAVLYTDGGWRDNEFGRGAGMGVHGYMFNELPSTRFSKIPHLITPIGYQDKMTGVQLKDDSYNPKYSQWDYEVEAKKDGVKKDDDSVLFVDGIIPCDIDGQHLAQYCELSVFIRLFKDLEHEFEYLTVHTDSNYLCKGYNEYMTGWIKRGWRKSNGAPVGNLPLWKEIAALKEQFGDKIQICKITAHAGHFGNECADANATKAVTRFMNCMRDSEWVYTPSSDTNYWEPEKDIPLMLRQKWCYGVTNQNRTAYDIDGEKYNEFVMGNHADKDEIDLLGKFLPDSAYSIVLTKDECPLLDEIPKYHVKYMWGDEDDMYRSEYIIMTNIANVNSPKTIMDMRIGGLDSMPRTKDRNTIVEPRKNGIVSRVIRPMLQSYRYHKLRQDMVDTLSSYVMMQGRVIEGMVTQYPIILNDITDYVYSTVEDKKGKTTTKLSTNIGNTDHSWEFMVNHPINDLKAKVILTRSLDFPDRSILAGLADKNPKVSIATWMYDGLMFSYAVIVESDEGYGLWTSSGSQRLLSTKEQGNAS